MDLSMIYHNEILTFLRELASAPPMQRLKQVGMNCGCEYTSFPRFCELKPYSRYDHSLGVGLIVWHFTGDPAQAAAGLLHDISTPAFAHVVDFLRGDSLTQEATEEGTAELISSSAELTEALRRFALTADAVSDYHRYPIADNDTPRLSADRLEYTLGNALNYGFAGREELKALYEDLIPAPNEEGTPELQFRTPEKALRFAKLSLNCSKVYVSEEDRYAMQRLSELLAEAIRAGVLRESDLMSPEPCLIEKLCADPVYAAAWGRFRSLHRMLPPAEAAVSPDRRVILAKKRRIDPLILGRGRCSAVDPDYRAALEAFLREPQEIPIAAE